MCNNINHKALSIAILVGLYSFLSIGSEAPAQSFINEELKVNKTTILACATSDDASQCIGRAANQCQRIHDDGFDGGTTHGIATCLKHEAKIWDSLLSLDEKELYSYYAEQDTASLYTRVSRVKSFQQAQISWRAHLKSECRFQTALNQAGTIRSIIAAGCELSMIAKRLLYLKDLQNKDM